MNKEMRNEILMRVVIIAAMLRCKKNIFKYEVHKPLDEFLDVATKKAFAGYTKFPELDLLWKESNHKGEYSTDTNSCWFAQNYLFRDGAQIYAGLSSNDFFRLEELMYLLESLHGNNGSEDVTRLMGKADCVAWEKPHSYSWEN